MKGKPQWKERVEAWSERPPRLAPEDARRRILGRIEIGQSSRWTLTRWMAPGRQVFALALATAAAAVLAIALYFSAESRPESSPVDIAHNTTLVLELPSGSTLYLTTQEASR